jgi:SAM-dependent methyltransferase
VGSVGRLDGISAVDLGAGTGFSASSLIRALPVSSLMLIEPDAAMLGEAGRTLQGCDVRVEYRVGSAESVSGVTDVDLVLAASSWHWMDPNPTINSIHTMLRPGGVFFVVEYQFPRLENAPEINEWVRREFNLKWRAPDQRPRGSLKELTEPVRKADFFSQGGALRVEHAQEFTLEEFVGVIRSQSRYLAHEARLSDDQRREERVLMVDQLRQVWGNSEEILGSYSLEGYWFVKRWG